jgi:hypothetical protein
MIDARFLLLDGLRGYENEEIVISSKGNSAMPLYIDNPEVDQPTGEVIHPTKSSKVAR